MQYACVNILLIEVQNNIHHFLLKNNKYCTFQLVFSNENSLKFSYPSQVRINCIHHIKPKFPYFKIVYVSSNIFKLKKREKILKFVFISCSFPHFFVNNKKYTGLWLAKLCVPDF